MNQADFFNSENLLKYDYIKQSILVSQNPFPRNPVTSKDNLPQFCLGRVEEIGIIKNAIEKVSNDPGNKSAWIPIHGDGGTGKSTITLYVYNKVRTNSSSDLDVDHLEAAYVNIPADPKYLTISFIYQKIIEDLGDSPETYPYFLGFQFVKKLYGIIEKMDMVKEEFTRKFGNAWSKLKSCNDYKYFLIKIKKEAPKFPFELVEFIKEYDFLIQSELKLNLKYIEKLIETISENKKIRRKACEEILGKNIKDEEYAREMFENFIKSINLIFDRNCLLVIMDNLENLNLEEIIFRDFFKFLIAFRNHFNNCLLLTIGSTKFWEFFRNTISMSEWNMLEGFRYDELSLHNLSEEDASRILMRHMSEFWNSLPEESKPIGKDMYFPFSKSAFKYIYETNDRNLRDSLKFCNRLIEKFKENKEIIYYKNLKNSIFYLRPKLSQVYLFENELNYLFKFLNSFTDRNNLSRKIEVGLVRAFFEIKSHQKQKYISNVEHEPKITLIDGTICKPDVYLTLFGRKNIEDIRHVEIQVKTSFPTNPVRISNIQSSIDLLKNGKSDFLHFITLSPLENNIIEELNGFKNHIGRVTPLEGEEPAYLSLLISDYGKLFYQREILTPEVYREILSKIGLEIPDFFNKIKELPPIQITSSSKPHKGVQTQTRQTTFNIPPKTPSQKIYNPKELESHVIELFKKQPLIPKKDDIIKGVKDIAGSTSVINNAISNLQKSNKIKFSRSKPQGWSLIS